jgi:hypothetical protein
MDRNVFLLNEKNELLLYYEKKSHNWKIPSYDMLIEDIQIFYEEKYNIKKEADKIINNNYICNITNLFILNKYQKWFRFYDIVQMQLYEQHKDIIDEIYKDLKLTIILDIDLTLLESHNNHSFIKLHPDYIMESNYGEYQIFLRPHLKYFLDSISKFTNIIYWTAATKEHQEQVLKITGLDKYCQDVYYRDTCIYQNKNYIKDITKINIKTNRTLLIDDNEIHKAQNPHNCFLIRPWGPNFYYDSYYDSYYNQFYMEDMELIKMINVLRMFSDNIIHNNYSLEKCFNLLNV